MRYFVGDFETTVYAGQKSTEVWASACVELGTEDVHIFHSIADQYKYFVSLNCNIICYYHNLKFDGNFWLYYLLVDLGYEQAYVQTGETVADISWLPRAKMKNKSVAYLITSTGLWYNLIVKVGGHIIEFRDSLKLLPFTVKRIGESFKTKHRKLEMEYTGFRYAGCEITPEEAEYISNDILVVKGMNEGVSLLISESKRVLIRIVVNALNKANLSTVAFCCLNFGNRRAVRQADHRLHAVLLRREGDPLRVVTCGAGNNTLFLFLFRQHGDLKARTAELKRTGMLQILRL